MPRNTTLHDVAAAVGVSARTVSRAVNGEPGLSDATRKRVLETVQKMNYQTNMLARGLRANRSNTLGLIVTDLTDPFFPALAQSVQQTASQSGHTLILASTQNDRATEDAVLSSIRARGVDGAIVFPSGDSTPEEWTAVAQDGLAMVVIDDGGSPADGIRFIDNDLQGGARSATRHLIDLGHRHIAMISNSLSPARRNLRDHGYKSEMRSAGLEADIHIVHREPTLDGGAAAIDLLLDDDAAPTAIFAYNDLMAIGALRQIRARGLQVPRDISLVGFDDISLASLVTPPLTTVRINRERLGQLAVSHLLAVIEGQPADETTTPALDAAPTALECSLVVRESSAPPTPSPRQLSSPIVEAPRE